MLQLAMPQKPQQCLPDICLQFEGIITYELMCNTTSTLDEYWRLGSEWWIALNNSSNTCVRLSKEQVGTFTLFRKNMKNSVINDISMSQKWKHPLSTVITGCWMLWMQISEIVVTDWRMYKDVFDKVLEVSPGQLCEIIYMFCVTV